MEKFTVIAGSITAGKKKNFSKLTVFLFPCGVESFWKHEICTRTEQSKAETNNMTTAKPLVSKVAFTSLTTSKREHYDELIKFYRKFGFKVIRIFNKDANETSADLNGISFDSRSECWLATFPVSRADKNGNVIPYQETPEYKHREMDPVLDKYNQGVLLKIRLFSHDVPKNEKMPGRIVVLSYSPDKIRQIATESGIEILEGNEVEKQDVGSGLFFVRDPVGNLVGFTDSVQLGQKIAVESAGSFFISEEAAKEAEEAARLRDLKKASKETKPQKRIAVMTSGGDSQGMCAAVRAVIRAGIYFGCEMYGCFEGYTGLVEGGDKLRPLKWSDVRGWLSEGGTLIGTARCLEFRERAGRLNGAENMVKRGIDALIVCGGDGSLTGADIFRSEWPSLLEELEKKGRITAEQKNKYQHLTIVGMVGSIDNDMAMTDNTIGAYSSLERICEMVDYIDTTAASHSRAFVVEVMGRHCGWLALMAGICCGADYVFVPEQPPCAKTWRKDLQAVCLKHRAAGRRKTTVIVAEGAIDDELNEVSSEDVKDALVELGLDTRVTTLGHVQRGGTAVAFDRLLATMQGVEAVKAALESTPETPSPMIGIEANQIVRVPLMEAVKQTKAVAKAIEAKDFAAAFNLRDAAFQETWTDFKAISGESERADEAKAEPDVKEEPKTHLNVAIIHVGAPTAALNAATRSAVLYLLSQGHTVYGIENGFTGLIRHGSFRKLSWLDVVEWHNIGGSFLGTNRSLPSEDMGTVAFYLQKYQIQGLIIMGGFEAFRAVHELKRARTRYPILNLPTVCLPSTVSNNVPGTEYSLGCDTCLNVLSKYCDAIKQSASSSRKRVFVVEVQGGNCGYVASYIGLISGAVAVYRPEEGIALKDISSDLKLLKTCFAGDKGEDRNGKLVVRNENSSPIYTTQLVADIFREQAKGAFQTRTAIPGHVQQGKIPSAMDRCYAARFAIKACKYIEQNNEEIAKSVAHWKSEGFGSNHTDIGDPDEELKFFYKHGHKIEAPELNNAVVLGIHGNKVSFESISKLWESSTDIELRRGVEIHWQKFNVVNDVLSGRLLARRQEEQAEKVEIDVGN